MLLLIYTCNVVESFGLQLTSLSNNANKLFPFLDFTTNGVQVTTLKSFAKKTKWQSQLDKLFTIISCTKGRWILVPHINLMFTNFTASTMVLSLLHHDHNPSTLLPFSLRVLEMVLLINSSSSKLSCFSNCDSSFYIYITLHIQNNFKTWHNQNPKPWHKNALLAIAISNYDAPQTHILEIGKYTMSYSHKNAPKLPFWVHWPNIRKKKQFWTHLHKV